MRIADSATDAILTRIGAAAAGLTGVELEFSIELHPSCVEDYGRFTIWTAASAAAREQVNTLLACHGAPAEVGDALCVDVPVRYGLSVSVTESGPEYRLYVHDRHPDTSADRYEARVWQAGKQVRRARYTFSYFPATPDGVCPIDLISSHHQAVADLLADERLRRASGFWLRSSDGHTFDRLDLAYPWHPPARTLGGVVAVAERLGIALDHPSRWADLCIRHVSFAVGQSSPKMTLYASAPYDGSGWPRDERALQTIVRRGARRHHDAVEEQVFSTVPPLPPIHEAGNAVGRFYDVDVDVWKRLLGDELHYHNGLFDGDLAVDTTEDAAMNAALRRAVTELYPFIPRGARVYDIGCGWGGPLRMLSRERGCVTLGATVSRKQYEYVAHLGLPVRWADAECTLPPGMFDCILMLESFEHVVDKERLLRVLRPFAKRLVIRTNCQDRSVQKTAFAGTMHMISSSGLRALLESTGWRVTHWRNRRPEVMRSVDIWNRRLQGLALTDDAHVEAFRSWSARVVAHGEDWSAANPLIEVIAEA